MLTDITNYFRGTKSQPYHLSVGAVLVNDKAEIACHHFEKIQGLRELYILVRETMEPGETIENTLARGLMEEFGAKGDLTSYLGSLTSAFERDGENIQKTTLYFLVELKSIDTESRMADDPEKDSQIEWHPAEFLIKKMKVQGAKYKRSDLDESEILDRFLATQANRL